MEKIRLYNVRQDFSTPILAPFSPTIHFSTGYRQFWVHILAFLTQEKKEPSLPSLRYKMRGRILIALTEVICQPLWTPITGILIGLDCIKCPAIAKVLWLGYFQNHLMRVKRSSFPKEALSRGNTFTG